MPRAAARFNRLATNRMALLFAGVVPGFGIIQHVGRRSGTVYRTPLLVFPTNRGFVVLLGYGPQTQWVKNVVAAGGATVRSRGESIDVTNPSFATKAEAAPAVRASMRWFYKVFPYNESALVLERAE